MDVVHNIVEKSDREELINELMSFDESLMLKLAHAVMFKKNFKTLTFTQTDQPNSGAIH